MEREPLRVGLIGYGAIGQDVFGLLAERATKDVMVVGALVRDPTQPRPQVHPSFSRSQPCWLSSLT